MYILILSTVKNKKVTASHACNPSGTAEHDVIHIRHNLYLIGLLVLNTIRLKHIPYDVWHIYRTTSDTYIIRLNIYHTSETYTVRMSEIYIPYIHLKHIWYDVSTYIIRLKHISYVWNIYRTMSDTYIRCLKHISYVWNIYHTSETYTVHMSETYTVRLKHTVRHLTHIVCTSDTYGNILQHVWCIYLACEKYTYGENNAQK